jgi:hypothetical protein
MPMAGTTTVRDTGRMNVDKRPDHEQPVREADRRVDTEPVAPPGRPTLDDIGEWSFPASDPPANWTWDVHVKRSS